MEAERSCGHSYLLKVDPHLPPGEVTENTCEAAKHGNILAHTRNRVLAKCCLYISTHTHTQVVHGVCVNSSSLSHQLTSSSPYRKLIRRCLCLYMRDQAFSTGDLLPTQMSPELQRKILPEIINCPLYPKGPALY